MRRFAPLSALALVLATALPLRAQNVSGTWELTYSTQRGERTITLELAQQGATVTGKVILPAMGARGGGGGNPPPNMPAMPREVEIKDGKIEGNKLTFSYEMGMGERSFTQTFTATVSADGKSMEGTMTGGLGMGGAAPQPIPFKGVKKEG